MKALIEYKLLFLSIYLLCLPGCLKVVDWVKDEVPQVCKSERNVLLCPDIQTLRLYDQLTLKGTFDVLWLSKKIKEQFADMYAHKKGFSQEQKASFLKNEFEEDSHFITFYILSLFTVELGKESDWNVTLTIDGIQYPIIELKPIDLPYEYQYMFGKKWNNFKKAYRARFTSKEIVDKISLAGLKNMVLTFHRLESESGQLHGYIDWDISKN